MYIKIRFIGHWILYIIVEPNGKKNKKNMNYSRKDDI